MRRALVLAALAIIIVAVALWPNPEPEPFAPQAGESAPAESGAAAALDSAARDQAISQQGTREPIAEVVSTTPPASPHEVITRLSGEVFAQSEIFGGDRAGITVYCWPGWHQLAPPKVTSLDQLKNLQSTVTDSAGRFSFDLHIDDVHWLFAVADGMCSDPAGMRIGTKPQVEVMMEMRRLHAARYRFRVGDDLHARQLDGFSFRALGSVALETLDYPRFPTAFVPSLDRLREEARSLLQRELMIWLPPEAVPPVAMSIKGQMLGCPPISEQLNFEPLTLDGSPPIQLFQIEPNRELGTLVLDVRGVPDAARHPFAGPLLFQMWVAGEPGTKLLVLDHFGDFPWRLENAPEGEYRLLTEDHLQSGLDLGAPQVFQVRAGETTRVELDFSAAEFLVFSRDPALEDYRFLTPPDLRIAHRGSLRLRDWRNPSQTVVLRPLVESESLELRGDIFLDGPQGPRRDGRVTVYTAGNDDD